ncbi:helix-turn-helix domain-containing protein [Priestia flexa]|uniref:Helix-turn-helix domain-containing protein n=1 Tax=Priestia flexa TaxID=86664 RepID=A0A8I1MBX8_9BACI|nr:helix-turn-helix domain-containing protein [Priestia flexa]MBN8250016.1 helix-turn-helix domain-containing protein [Priestia flexa]MBN8434661.1 helix-turn-helix domain-containing protein [Priestia flexa]RIV15841.1 helix-turn-helix domain-containing protein [Priestia flexa]
MTELGQRLRQERENKGMSLEDLQKNTKIQKRYLIGIEEGNYDVMPGKFYVRAFIKQYCEAVGLNPDDIFDQYKTDIPTTQTDDIPQPLSRVRSRKEIPQNTKASKAADYLPTILVVAGVLVVGIIIWVIAQNIVSGRQEDQAANTEQTNNEVQQSEEQQASNEDQAAKEAAEKEATEKEKAAKEDEEKKDEEKEETKQAYKEVQKSGRNGTYELSGTDEFKLEVSSTQADTWLDVKNGKGNSFYNAMLKNGETKEFDFTKESEVRVNIGFSPGVQLKINGQDVSLPFDANQQVRQVVTIKYEQEKAQ